MTDGIKMTTLSGEGRLPVTISIDENDWVKVDFGRDLSFFCVPRDQAIKLANAILQQAKSP